MAAGWQQLAAAFVFVVSGVLSFPLGQETRQPGACGYQVSCVHIPAVLWSYLRFNECVLVVKHQQITKTEDFLLSVSLIRLILLFCLFEE